MIPKLDGMSRVFHSQTKYKNTLLLYIKVELEEGLNYISMLA